MNTYDPKKPSRAYINGVWVNARSNQVFEVQDPATSERIALVPDMHDEDAKLAVEAATKAFRTWKTTTAKERSDILRKWYNLLMQNQQELARVITLEAGKPLKESVTEVSYGNSFVEWFAEESRRCYGETIPSPDKTKELLAIRQPIGVIGIITPWNFPHAMITRKVAAALAAGCTCVVKPAEDTPLTALALAALAEKAGVPKGVLNVITCARPNAAAIGKLLCESPHVAGISFTGSTAVGKLLYQQCALGVKRVSLELGGNAPFIVFPSANLDQAVQMAMASKFRNCGQACISANRFLIHETVFDDFVCRMKQRVQSVVVADGKKEGADVGPLINVSQTAKVERLVQDAVSKGASLVTGGSRARDLGELFYQPTILTNVTPQMEIYAEEIFGPVVMCIKFRSEDEALEIANETKRGLAGYFFTSDIPQAWRVAKGLEVGMVGINEGLISNAESPFGGIKESGIGREGSRHGLDEYTFIKYLCFGNL